MGDPPGDHLRPRLQEARLRVLRLLGRRDPLQGQPPAVHGPVRRQGGVPGPQGEEGAGQGGKEAELAAFQELRECKRLEKAVMVMKFVTCFLVDLFFE